MPVQSGSGRKQWDKSEWEAKAKAKDEEHAEQAKAADAAMKQGEWSFQRQFLVHTPTPHHRGRRSQSRPGSASLVSLPRRY